MSAARFQSDYITVCVCLMPVRKLFGFVSLHFAALQTHMATVLEEEAR